VSLLLQEIRRQKCKGHLFFASIFSMTVARYF
jgi:hypothetical protein